MVNKINGKIGYLLAVSTLGLAGLNPTITIAQEERTGIDHGKYRIDIAGKQRMLTQRIAKAICFIELGHEIKLHHDMLETDYHTFDDTLHELRDGGGPQNLEPEKDRRTLAELKIVFEHWEPFAAEIEEIIATDHVSYEAEEHIMEENLIMLKDMNDTVSLIEQEYANPNTLDMSQAVTMNIFARQRMLSQMAAKDFCYVATAHHPEEERVNLDETKSLFTASLGALISGYEPLGIAPPPTEEISAQLAIVKDVWDHMDEIFTRIVAGAEPTPEEVAFISTESIHLQEEMNKAVQLYLHH